ncbi:MAG: Omp28-related outer membrane protein [Bacteroidales bacterium]|nr:Omp28-related outer membrane protein [Bacteroidales bacterium]
MKKIKILSILAALALSFAACDKIDSDQYVVFSGAYGTWENSEATIPAIQRAFVEKYTGVRCVNCPKADEVLHASAEKYGESLVIAAVHAPNNFGKPLHKDPDLRIEKGGVWFNEFFSVSQGLPCALLNRANGSGNLDIIQPTASFDEKIDAVLGQTPQVSLICKSSCVKDLNYNAEVHLQFNQSVSDQLTLTLFVIEDKIYTWQDKNGEGEVENYEQNHVLRQVITDAWGVDVEADGNQGTKRKVALSYELRSDCNAENCHLIAIVSNKANKQILNAAECKL